MYILPKDSCNGRWGGVTWFVVVDVEVEDGHNSDGQKRGPPVNDEHNDETEQRTNKAEPQWVKPIRRSPTWSLISENSL